MIDEREDMLGPEDSEDEVTVEEGTPLDNADWDDAEPDWGDSEPDDGDGDGWSDSEPDGDDGWDDSEPDDGWNDSEPDDGVDWNDSEPDDGEGGDWGDSDPDGEDGWNDPEGEPDLDDADDADDADDSDYADESDYAESGDSQDDVTDETFGGTADVSSTSDDEKMQNLLMMLNQDSYTTTLERIIPTDIGVPEFIKQGRQQTIKGLSASIKEMGVLTPVAVMKVSEKEATDGYKYILMDGGRRLFGTLKNKLETIPACIYDFKDKEKARDLLLPLTLTLNKQQRRRPAELWSLFRVLEMQYNTPPAAIEAWLCLEAGDAMRMKDVMLCEYEEIKQAYLDGVKTLDAAYKMLQKARKEEDQIAKEDSTAFTDAVGDAAEGADGITQDKQEAKERGQLSDEDTMELLEMVDDLDEGLDEEVGEDDFKEMSQADSDFVEQQKVGERQPLDPALRSAVLAKDKFTCQCCNRRLIGASMTAIAVHHKIPVHCSGKDEIKNLITLCVTCHLTLHVMERNGGAIMMSQEDFESLSDSEKASLKKANKLAKMAIEADKRQKLSPEKIKEATKESLKHPMPGQDMKENQAAYSKFKSSQS